MVLKHAALTNGNAIMVIVSNSVSAAMVVWTVPQIDLMKGTASVSVPFGKIHDISS